MLNFEFFRPRNLIVIAIITVIAAVLFKRFGARILNGGASPAQ